MVSAMPIQWYPGHMNKARRAIAEAVASTDVVIEVLDARMPRASANPVLTELRRGKPCLKALTKADLADPAATKLWVQHLEAPDVAAVALASSRPGEVRARVIELCKRLAPGRTGRAKMLRALIVGIPNVGKSTLINTLVGRSVAKVGDEPAVTKSQQLVTLDDGMMIRDNPGILWPTMDADEERSLRLALGGAVPDTVMDYESVGLFAARLFLASYPELLRARYKLDALPASPTEALEAIGRRRGCLRSGGVIDMHKASDALVHDFRSGVLGRISLETP